MSKFICAREYENLDDIEYAESIYENYGEQAAEVFARRIWNKVDMWECSGGFEVYVRDMDGVVTVYDITVEWDPYFIAKQNVVLVEPSSETLDAS